MQLKSLEINGFKSFAKKGNLVFNSPITSIVGPNGSGKSNVAESFRFVLGEQSIKSMRGKKGEDLIFNGGKDTPRANRASVKLVFDNKTKLFKMDFDEISLERVVHRDGVNEYYINGSQVRLKDVAEMLAHANIGSSGHHIISQGEADRLLSSNPEERREMIEDALGLKVFQYKKEESEKKLEKTAQHIKEVESLRREIAPHIRFLKKQVEKIEKAAALRAELSVQYREYFAREEAYLKKEKKRLTDAGIEPRNELEKIEVELNHHKKVLDEMSKGDNNHTHLLDLEKLITTTRHKKDVLMRDIGRLEGEMSYIKKTIESKIKEAEKENSSHKMISLLHIESLAKDVNEHLHAVLNSDNLEVIKNSASEIKRLVADFIHHHKNEGEAPVVSTKSDEEDLLKVTSKISEIEDNLKNISTEEKNHESKYQELKSKIDKDKENNVESEKAILRIMSRQNELHGLLHSIKAETDRMALEQTDYDRELQEAGMLIGREAIAFYEEDILSHMDNGEARNVQVDRRRAIEKSKIRLEEMGGAGGQEVMKEYKDAEDRDQFLMKELGDLMQSSETLNTLIADLTEKLNEMFKDGIKKINTEFDRFFKLMFGGGEARLEIIKEVKKKRRKSEDELEVEMAEEEEVSEGIDIHVALPHKKTKGLMMLSGGERALTSIALLFAMSQVNPPPFIILDETDAALDEANSRKYGDMIEALSKHSQLILITHNRETMSRAGVIYGVTMAGEGHSKLLSIAFDEAVVVAK
ncbi:MAG: AAA family ATPase [bacterium]